MNNTVSVTEVKAGQVLSPDGWNGLGSTLQAGTWDERPDALWLPSGLWEGHGSHVEVKVTGRTQQLRNGEWVIRCRITWPGDCEADKHSGGWLRPEWNDWNWS